MQHLQFIAWKMKVFHLNLLADAITLEGVVTKRNAQKVGGGGGLFSPRLTWNVP